LVWYEKKKTLLAFFKAFIIEVNIGIKMIAIYERKMKLKEANENNWNKIR
jgi:hypothetical protein